MEDFNTPWSGQLAEIIPVSVDLRVIEGFESEGRYVGLAVDLTIEAGSYVCIAASISRNNEMSWTRDEAILGGHLVRLFKLLDALLDQTCRHRRETSMVVARLIFECIVNLRYLVAHASGDLFRSYRVQSLRQEIKLLDCIEKNISERQDSPLPIEQRMMKSIHASFRASGVTRQEVVGHKQRNWSGLNLYERARSVGLEQAYLAVFGGGSHSIHGNWQDLLEYHLEKVDDNTYRPCMEWHNPRPQILEALVTLVTDAVAEYLRYFTENTALDLLSRLQDLKERTARFSALHEAFLVRKTGDV